MLGLWSLGSAPMALSLHVAFTVSLPDVLRAAGHLRARGITPLSFFGAETEEPSVIGWMPAAAVYFRDPDGHQLEYLAMLDAAPRPDLGIVPWSSGPMILRASTSAGTPGTARRSGRSSSSRRTPPSSSTATWTSGGSSSPARRRRSSGTCSSWRADGRGSWSCEHGRRGRPSAPRHRARAGAARHRGRPRRGRRSLLVATATADTGNLHFYQRMGFRMLRVEPDAFTPAEGYPDGVTIDGIALRDRVWLARSP